MVRSAAVRPPAVLPVVLLAVLLAPILGACTSGPDPAGGGGHTHTGGAMVSLPVGDGTKAYEVGYTLADVRLPARAGETGEASFRIDTFRGRAQTNFLVEQTKELHLYLVREDLTVFRHLHPSMAADGTWSAPVSLPSTGRYRVIAEFVAEDAGGNGDHVILGRTVAVTRGDAAETGETGTGEPGEHAAIPVADLDPVVRVEVTQAPRVGPDGRLRLMVRDARDRPVLLDTYLGTYGHVTGFEHETGSMLHLHPMSAPEVTEDGTELTFHSEIEQAGHYRLFVQVRVDGYIHTVPVELTVT